MRAYIDTNILIDSLDTSREGYNHACTIFDLARDGKIELFLSTQSMLDAFYISRKHAPSVSKLRQSLLSLTRYINVVDIHVFGVRKALASDERDVEDLAQAATAEREGCDVIITNDKDFPDYPAEHPLKTMSSRSFVDVCRRAS